MAWSFDQGLGLMLLSYSYLVQLLDASCLCLQGCASHFEIFFQKSALSNLSWVDGSIYWEFSTVEHLGRIQASFDCL